MFKLSILLVPKIDGRNILFRLENAGKIGFSVSCKVLQTKFHLNGHTMVRLPFSLFL